jgi:hypothetical protein
MKRTYYGLFFISLVTLLAVWHAYNPTSSVHISAQAGCVPPAIDATGNRWSTGARVTVKIHSAFTINERGKIEEAFRNWNAASIANCSGVIFEGFDVIDAQPPDHLDWYWVGFNPSTSGSNPGVTLIGSIHFARTYLYGYIRSCQTGECLAFLLGLMRHEIGHTIGLANTMNCRSSNTVMCHIPDENSVITACDTAAVRSLYCAPGRVFGRAGIRS